VTGGRKIRGPLESRSSFCGEAEADDGGGRLVEIVDAVGQCWRSGTFPLCDGSHVKHNKATGDNVGPLLLKKQ
ncbi:hypothetical protein RJ640_022903, partial [Escallonia rubra]